MKKTILLAIVVLILGFITWKVIKKNPATNTSYDTSASEFAIPEIEKVRRVFIADKSGQQIDLKKQRDGWIVNDQYLADQNSIDLLLRGMQNLGIKYIPPKAAHPNIIKTMASFGILVEAYGRGGEQLKKYFVGGMTQDERGTYFLMDGANQPYVMELPGFVGNLRERYRPEIKRFRTQKFMHFDPRAIKLLSVQYPEQPDHDFKIRSILTGFELETQAIKQKANKGMVDSYLEKLKDLACESFLIDDIRQDSVTTLPPFCSLKLEMDNGDQHNVLFWQKFTPVVAGQQSLNRFFILKNEDFMLGQYEVIKEAFRNGVYFLQ